MLISKENFFSVFLVQKSRFLPTPIPTPTTLPDLDIKFANDFFTMLLALGGLRAREFTTSVFYEEKFLFFCLLHRDPAKSCTIYRGRGTIQFFLIFGVLTAASNYSRCRREAGASVKTPKIPTVRGGRLTKS